MSDIISSELEIDEKNSWGTDPLVFRAMDREFNFALDAASNSENHKVPNFLTKEDDALSVDWSKYVCGYQDKTVWVNPPYGRGYIQKFMNKAVEQKAKGVTTVMLVPATLDAQWLPINEISEIRIITGGRLSFMHPSSGKKIAGNTKGSMFVIFSPSLSPLVTRYVNRDELVSQGSRGLDSKEAA